MFERWSFLKLFSTLLMTNLRMDEIPGFIPSSPVIKLNKLL